MSAVLALPAETRARATVAGTGVAAGVERGAETAATLGPSAGPTPSPAASIALSPAVRLARSRERLRAAMHDAAVTPRGVSAPRAAGSAMAWLDSLKTAFPGAAVIMDAVRSWWTPHPLRIAGMVADDAAKAVLRPFAQRHPLALVAGAMLLGGLLAWAHPWRGFLKSALFAGLLPQLIAKVLAQVPSRSWMAVLTSLLQEPRGPPARAEPRG